MQLTPKSNADEMKHKIHEHRIIEESSCDKDRVFSLKIFGLKAYTMAISILSSKLHIPQRRSDDVLRKRLIERLDKTVLDAKLILVSAPAGFGKTTILSTWLAESKFATAWLSLDANDSEFVQFLSYLIAAIQMIQPEIGSIALEALQSSRQANPESLLISLINDLAKVPGPFLIVLDDYHLIDSEGIDKALEYLIEYMPEPRLYPFQAA